MTKRSVLILFGGRSNEYEVSLRTACSILENIDREVFSPVAVGITREGEWRLFRGENARIREDRWAEEACSCPAILSPDTARPGLWVFEGDTPALRAVDVVFPALHGKNCEDGSLQGLLELSGIPYVGCGVTASALCMDKEYNRIVADRLGVPTIPWRCLRKGEVGADFAACERRLAAEFGYPLFVKPANCGSSVGTGRADNAAELATALETAFSFDEKVLCEKFVRGQEVECAVLGNTALYAPLVGEIAPTVGFYDYEAKYENDSAALHIPARLPQAITDEIRDSAQRLFRALDARGLARVDFFVTEEGRVLYNETNTLPGFTSISMYPKLMLASGLSYTELITRLVDLAAEDRQKVRVQR